MTKTIEYDGHQFDVVVVFDPWGVDYRVWLVTHPERKHFFRSTYLGSQGFWLSDLESVDEGIMFAVQKVWAREQQRLLNEKKIENFKKSC